MNIKYLLLFFCFFCFLFLFNFISVYQSIDPDFGWHLRTGELILEKGIPYQDWYSYTMPNFEWINHEWLVDVFIYKIYSNLGFHFLLGVFLSIYIISFFIIKRPEQNFWDFFAVVTLGVVSTIGFVGIRPQLLTVFFVSLLLSLSYKFFNFSLKIIFLLPLIFFLWANLHGGFFMGLAIMVMIIFLEIFKKIIDSKKIKILNIFSNFKNKPVSWEKIIKFIIILFLCFLATFLNPYGINIYKEIFRTIGDNYVKLYISEWMPLLTFFNIFFYIYIGVFLGLLILYYKKIKIEDIIISLFFLFLANLSVRNFLLFVIITVPIMTEMFSNFKNELKKLYNINKLNKQIKILIIFIIIFLTIIYGVRLYSKNNSKNFYPEKSLSFLKEIPYSEKIFNNYGWGGYIIWKDPNRKIFIDGRMPCWRNKNQFIFKDYVKIMRAEDGFYEIMKNYDISIVIIPEYFKKNATTCKVTKLYNIPYTNELRNFLKNQQLFLKILNMQRDNKNNIYKELTKLGWKTIYQDDVSIILKKPK